MNSVCLTGHLTADPILKTTPTGVAVIRATIAVNRKPNANGEKMTDFINVIIWRKSAENVSKYCAKGSLIGITGRIQTNQYTDQNGQKKYSTEVLAETITFLGGNKKSENQNTQQIQPPASQGIQVQTRTVESDDPFASFGEEVVINEEDLPF